jgi:hypothetical protein
VLLKLPARPGAQAAQEISDGLCLFGLDVEFPLTVVGSKDSQQQVFQSVAQGATNV